jgi:hypothetical protein
MSWCRWPLIRAVASWFGARSLEGCCHEEQLADNLAAADLALSAEELDLLDKVSAQPRPYPYWHQAKNLGRPGKRSRSHSSGASHRRLNHPLRR